MCGRYAILLPPDAMRQLYRFLGPLPNWPPRYNVAPTQSVPIIRAAEQGRELAQVRWGLVPFWSKDIGAQPLINARGESVHEKPSFREAFARRRCLAPADGFYEWLTIEGQARKQPVFIRLKGGAPFAFGAIWDRWKASDGTVLESMAIVTTSANAALKGIHDRMPVMLAPEDWDAWLASGQAEAGSGPRSLIRPYNDDSIEFWPVSQKVSVASNEGAELIAAIEIPAATPNAAPPPAPLKPARAKKTVKDDGQGSLF